MFSTTMEKAVWASSRNGKEGDIDIFADWSDQVK
jgi:hypothetical protein